MAKVNIYLRDDTLAFAKAAAAQANLSVSAWFAQLARARVEKDLADAGKGQGAPSDTPLSGIHHQKPSTAS